MELLYIRDRIRGWSSDLDGLFIRATRLRHRHRRLCIRIRGRLSVQPKSIPQRIPSVSVQVTPPMGPRQLTFHRVFSWQQCKVAGILMGGCFFLSYRETRTCLSSSNLYPFIPRNRYPDLRGYIFLLAAFSDISTDF